MIVYFYRYLPKATEYGAAQVVRRGRRGNVYLMKPKVPSYCGAVR